MSRDLTSGFISAITAQGTTPILLLRAYFDSGDLNLWNGIGDLTYSGVTYIGVSPILLFDNVKEQTTLAATGLNITLSGLDADIIDIAFNEPYEQRSLEMYLAMLDSSGNVIISPYMLFKGYMDTMKLSDDGKNVTIAVAVENELIALERALDSTYTPENQQIEFPNDTGFNFVAGLQTETVQWG